MRDVACVLPSWRLKNAAPRTPRLLRPALLTALQCSALRCRRGPTPPPSSSSMKSTRWGASGAGHRAASWVFVYRVWKKGGVRRGWMQLFPYSEIACSCSVPLPLSLQQGRRQGQ